MSENEILDEIMDYFFNGDWKSFKEVEEFVNEKLRDYSEEKKKEIEKEIYSELGEFYYENTNPLLAVTPLRLSQMLYENAVKLSKEVVKVLKEGIEAKETVRDIAMKLYEGYDFKDKEILSAKKVLPKYLQKAIEKKDKEIMKQIEKLKTKPLRIAYKDIVRNMDKLSDGALEKYIKTAYHEKMRYYAKRIADTETHRAMMTKRAYEYLNDENIEFVKFEMSSRHPKTDICDFYANLDVGYGRGIVPKREMRTTPLHPHCYDAETEVYTHEGWKKFKDISMNELFLSFNPENNEIEFVRAKNFVCWFNKGRMISFQHKHFDLLVTDKHKMVVYKRVFQNKKRIKKLQFVEADRCFNSEFLIPRTALWRGKEQNKIKIGNFNFDSFAFCEFMGYWLSDGSVTKRKNHYQITIAQENNQERIFNVIEKLGFKPFYAKKYVGFSNKDFGEYLMKFGKAKEKFVPREIKELSSKYLWKFLEAFVSCDGSIRPEKDFKGYKSKPEFLFYTSSKRLADDLGEIILKCGYQPSFYLQKSKGKEVVFKNGKYTINEDIWIIRLKRSRNANVSNLEIKEVDYNNYVYCVELEKYNILWVRRNGKTCFSGNCHCVYAPYYGKVKGKRKPWKQAVNETMSKFTEREQREILGTYAMLERFKAGEDIEKIFNTIRPKYPIRKYAELFGKKEYNFEKREELEIENKILKRVELIKDVEKDFYKLWMSKESFETHIEKRKNLRHITNKEDYILKTLDCIIEADEYILAIHKKSWDNLCYNKKSNWAVIFNENGELMTSYKVEPDKKSFEELHKEVGGVIIKGEVNEKIKRAFKKLRDRYKKLGK